MVLALTSLLTDVLVVMVTLLHYDVDMAMGLFWAVLVLPALYYALVLAGLSRRTRQLKQRA